jgi:Ca2+/Na+ antiporter
MELSILANIATVALFLGTIPSIRAVVKDRTALKGFSVIGSFSFFLGQLIFVIYFILVGDWVTVILLIPLATFWFLVFSYKVKEQINNK